jgi:hypothetical protein
MQYGKACIKDNRILKMTLSWLSKNITSGHHEGHEEHEGEKHKKAHVVLRVLRALRGGTLFLDNMRTCDNQPSICPKLEYRYCL